MIIVMCVSAAVCLIGVAIVSLAKRPSASSAGIIITIVGAVCLVISFLAWVPIGTTETHPAVHRANR